MLIVDDYPPGRHALQQQLEKWGHQVIQAENGEQAISYWEHQNHSIDLVITDCTMPVMDGFALVRWIRQQEERRALTALPVVGLTALSGFEVVEQCLEAGMNECLTRPLESDALFEVLRRYFPDNGAEAVPPPIKPDAGVILKREILELNAQDSDTLRVAMAQQNIHSVGHVAHRIRGGAALLKEHDLFNTCGALEKACEKNASWDEISLLAEELLVDLDKVNNAIMLEINEC